MSNFKCSNLKKDENVPYPAWLAEGSACAREVQFLGVPAWNDCQYRSDLMAAMEELNLQTDLICVVLTKEVCYFLRKMAKHRVGSKSTWFCPTGLCPMKCTPAQLECPTTAKSMNDVTPAPCTNPYVAPDSQTPPRLIFLIQNARS